MELGINLDQLRIFATVAETGSFSAAARRLNRSQSTVTYAVQKLEGAVGLALFDRAGYRPELTEAGRALLPRARRVVEASAALDTQARAFRDGIEAELSLVVDAMVPMAVLFDALSAFDARFPTVQTRLYVESLGATAQTVIEGRADLGLVVHFANIARELAAVPMGVIELVPVAAPGHRLARRLAADAAPLTEEELRDELQLVLTDRSDLTRGQDHGVLSVRSWRLADLGAKHAMLLAGLGWGNMPLHMVADDIAAERLTRLNVGLWRTDARRPNLSTMLVHRHDRPLGPAGSWLRGRLLGEPQPGA